MEYVKFSNLDHGYKMNLFAAWLDGKQIQASSSAETWVNSNVPRWADDTYYRIKSIELTKPTVTWDHININYNWIATDADARCYIYPKEPKRFANAFNHGSNENPPMCAGGLASYRPGTCDWEDSLACRPGFEDEICGL